MTETGKRGVGYKLCKCQLIEKIDEIVKSEKIWQDVKLELVNIERNYG